MDNITIHHLSIKDDLFAKFGDDFDHILAGIVKNMNEQQVEEAEITAKMAIKLDLVQVPYPTDANLNGHRDALVPTIKHTIASAIKIKNEKKGCIPEGYELVQDPVTGCFVLVKVSNGQSTMFDRGGMSDDWPFEADGESREATDAGLGLPDSQCLLESHQISDDDQAPD